MKKIIIAFDGQHYSEGALHMTAWLNEQQPIMVAGIFLSPVDYKEVIGYSGMTVGVPVVVPAPVTIDDSGMERNISQFEAYCQRQGIEYRVHRDTDLFALQGLVTETRFADLLILSSELFYENIDQLQPNEYLRQILHRSECPVMLVPEHYEMPGNLVLAYDGKAESVYAIKQFAYLFPQLCALDTLLVTLGENQKEPPSLDLITELAGRHFPSLTLETLTNETRTSFGSWMNGRKQALLVSGAFGRGELSTLFRHSFITDVIRQHKVPIFVSHQ